MLKVAIVEDNDIIREGFQLLINGSKRYKCSSAYSNCEEFLDDFYKNKPDFVLMDLGLPGMSGIEGIKKIQKISEEVLTIVLTVYGENELLFEAIKAGACGYILKKSPQEKILNILDDLSKGKSAMSAQIAIKMLSVFEQNSNRKTKRSKVSLTEEEDNILKHRVEGNSPKAIADSLTITTSQVYSDFFNIYRKLQKYSV